jgi:1,4-dihydroxy-2-naphthoate octaprenyltransferase
MATLCKFRIAVHTTGILDQGHSVSVIVHLVSIDHAVHLANNYTDYLEGIRNCEIWLT